MTDTHSGPERVSYGLIQGFNMAHTVDLTFEDPRFDSDPLYGRVFGQAEKHHSLDDRDLTSPRKKSKTAKSSDVRVVGHSENDG